MRKVLEEFMKKMMSTNDESTVQEDSDEDEDVEHDDNEDHHHDDGDTDKNGDVFQTYRVEISTELADEVRYTIQGSNQHRKSHLPTLPSVTKRIRRATKYLSSNSALYAVYM